jgi:CheY-like chemotaxis protein
MASPLDILLIVDSADDVRLVRQVLVASKLRNRVHVVGDGMEALAYLRGEPPYRNVPVPGLVMLDLGLPAGTGFGLWEEIRRETKLTDLPIVLLVESMEQRVCVGKLASDADLFLFKPVNRDKLLDVVRGVQSLSLMIMSDRVQ